MKKRAPIVRLCEFLGVYSADYVKSVIFAHITNESEYG